MQASSEPENAITKLMFGVFNSANILILPISFCTALNNTSILICILGLCITFVLYQEQRKLVVTNGSTAVSTPTPPSQTS
jgi:hypothetical protein